MAYKGRLFTSNFSFFGQNPAHGVTIGVYIGLGAVYKVVLIWNLIIISDRYYYPFLPSLVFTLFSFVSLLGVLAGIIFSFQN